MRKGRDEMMKREIFVPVIALGAFAGCAMGIGFGQLDDFEGGTTMNWAQGPPSPNQPTLESEAGNDFVQNISNGGGGPGSRMAFFNRAQWSGDYLTEGVSAISIDVRNAGNTDMNIRLGFQSNFGSRAVTNEAVALAIGSGWTTFTFDLTDMMVVSGGGTVNDLLGGVIEFRIISANAVVFEADPIAATLDVDNILATAIPAPGGAALFALGAVAARRRRRG